MKVMRGGDDFFLFLAGAGEGLLVEVGVFRVAHGSRGLQVFGFHHVGQAAGGLVALPLAVAVHAHAHQHLRSAPGRSIAGRVGDGDGRTGRGGSVFGVCGHRSEVEGLRVRIGGPGAGQLSAPRPHRRRRGSFPRPAGRRGGRWRPPCGR